MSPEIISLPFLLLAIALYCLPTGIAMYRNHPNGGPIMIINLLLGWTFLGWVIALAWACSALAATDATDATASWAAPYNVQKYDRY